MIKLSCGDCSKKMGGLASSSISLIVTDPPYGIDFKSNRQGVDRVRSLAREGDFVVRDSYFERIPNDKMLPTDWLSEAYRVLGDGTAMYVFTHWTRWAALMVAVSCVGFRIKNLIVLNKSNHGMGDLQGSYAPKYELLLFAVKGRHILRFPNGRGKDVWDVPVRFTGAHRYHPNEKPIAWVEPAILNSSDEGQIVLDPFCGSGSVGVACIKLHRDFIGYDVQESCIEMASKRLGIIKLPDPHDLAGGNDSGVEGAQ